MKTNPSATIMKGMPCLVLALCLMAFGPGCGNNGGGTGDGSSPKRLRLAFVANSPDDFWSMVRLGCDAATRQLGNVDLVFRIPVTPTAEAQQELLSNLVADGVDGIAVSPIDAESQTEFLNGIAAKTLLVCMDSDAEKSKRASFIGIDNVAAGKQAADLLKAALPNGGKIMVFASYLNAQNVKDRIQGLQAGLAGSQIQIVDILADGAKGEVAQKNAQDALAKYPDLAGMDCLNGYQGAAILTAVRGAGKAGQVKIVCFDDSSDTLSGIATGDVAGTILQSPNNFGYQTIVRMGKYLRGDSAELADQKILLPSQKLTKDKIVEFQAWRKTLLQNPRVEQK